MVAFPQYAKIFDYIFLQTAMSEFKTVAAVNAQQPGKCVMYGVCGKTSSDLDLNCKVDHPPKPLKNEGDLTKLRTYCPELIDEFGNELCCSPEQVENLISNLILPANILQRCPACFNNFRRSFCEFTCSPKQYLFVNVTETTPTIPPTPQPPSSDEEQEQESSDEEPPEEHIDVSDLPPNMVTKVDFFITRKYVRSTYDNCKNVLMSTTNGPSMDILCGPWGSYRCSAERWFDYMGSISNGYSPFDIKYRYTQSEDEASKNSNKKHGIHEYLREQDVDASEAVGEEIRPLDPKTYSCSDPMYATDPEVST